MKRTGDVRKQLACPSCGKRSMTVIDSRALMDGSAVRRRRVCEFCGGRFTTHEQIVSGALMADPAREGQRLYEAVAAALEAFCKKTGYTPNNNDQSATTP